MHIASACIFILIYVDDMIITSSSKLVVDQLITSLNHSFPIKNLGWFSYFLGVELTYIFDGLLFSQRKYILDLLTKTTMTNANPMFSPMAASTPLSKFGLYSFKNPKIFRSIVSSLLYFFLTRLNISFSINKFRQFMYDPKISH